MWGGVGAGLTAHCVPNIGLGCTAGPAGLAPLHGSGCTHQLPVKLLRRTPCLPPAPSIPISSFMAPPWLRRHSFVIDATQCQLGGYDPQADDPFAQPGGFARPVLSFYESATLVLHLEQRPARARFHGVGQINQVPGGWEGGWGSAPSLGRGGEWVALGVVQDVCGVGCVCEGRGGQGTHAIWHRATGAEATSPLTPLCPRAGVWDPEWVAATLVVYEPGYRLPFTLIFEDEGAQVRHGLDFQPLAISSPGFNCGGGM